MDRANFELIHPKFSEERKFSQLQNYGVKCRYSVAAQPFSAIGVSICAISSNIKRLQHFPGANLQSKVNRNIFADGEKLK